MKKITMVLMMVMTMATAAFALNPQEVAPDYCTVDNITGEVKCLEDAGYKVVYNVLYVDLEPFETLADALNNYFPEICEDFLALNEYDTNALTNAEVDEDGNVVEIPDIIIEGVVTYDGALAVIYAWN